MSIDRALASGSLGLGGLLLLPFYLSSSNLNVGSRSSGAWTFDLLPLVCHVNQRPHMRQPPGTLHPRRDHVVSCTPRTVHSIQDRAAEARDRIAASRTSTGCSWHWNVAGDHAGVSTREPLSNILDNAYRCLPAFSLLHPNILWLLQLALRSRRTTCWIIQWGLIISLWPEKVRSSLKAALRRNPASHSHNNRNLHLTR